MKDAYQTFDFIYIGVNYSHLFKLKESSIGVLYERPKHKNIIIENSSIYS
jgi:hypothetical protein